MKEESVDLDCEICGKHFTRSVGYDRHVKKCRESKLDDAYEWNILNKKNERFIDDDLLNKNHTSHLIEIVHDTLYECPEKFNDKKNLTNPQNEFPRTTSPSTKKCSKPVMLVCEICSKKFKTKESLRKHRIKCRLHDASASFVCSFCDKKFLDKRNLLRHKKTIHEVNVHQCSLCDKKFNRKDNFIRHLGNCGKRVVSDTYMCAYCGREFDKKYSLKWHIFRKHWDTNTIKCEICDAKFKGHSRDTALQKHVKEYHIDNNTVGTLKCALCVKAFSSRDNILRHLITEHDIVIGHQHLTFPSVDEFKSWKSNVEKTSFTFYRNRRGSNRSKRYAFSIYECHRSGCYQPKTDGRKRRIKVQGSKKMGAYCPAEMCLHVKKSDGSCRVSFVSLHLGHKVGDESELAHLSVPQDERAKIASKLSMGFSYDQILKEHLQSEQKRPFFLCRKDLNNISRSFNVKKGAAATNAATGPSSYESSSAVAAAAAALERVSVESFVCQHAQSIVFFKQPDDDDDDDDIDHNDDGYAGILKKDDFVMVVMTTQQKEILRKFGSKVVSVDGTFCLESCPFLLVALLVVDDYHEGIPVAFAVADRKTDAVIDVFLDRVKKEMGGPLETDIFMSDYRHNWYEKWQKIMGGAARNRPFCKWRMPQTWRRKLKKIALPERRNRVNERLFRVSTLLDEELFDRSLKEFFADTDPELQKFLSEFEAQHRREIEVWAGYFRDNAETNTNTHVESFNRTLKYFYGKLAKTETLGSVLTVIDEYLNFNECVMKRKQIRGILSKKLSGLRRRHDDCAKVGVSVAVESVAGEGWYITVTDERTEIANVHFIRECDDVCGGCKLYCEKCDTCAQKYRCTCPDNAVKNNMCMHIHALTMHRKGIANTDRDASSSQTNHRHSVENLHDEDDEDDNEEEEEAESEDEDEDEDDSCDISVRSNVSVVATAAAAAAAAAAINDTNVVEKYVETMSH